MRTDYGLYGIAVICFIIAGAFMIANVPGYTLQETSGIAVVMIFLIFGIISAAVGYSVRSKTIITTQPKPTPTAPITEKPLPPPTIPPKPAEESKPQPLIEVVAPEASQEPPMSSAPSEPSPPTVIPAEAEQPLQAAEEEKPKEKPVRRRRKKTE
jgi:type IV secretory pathway VirB10-like protein